jgi:hypothetical protein
MPHNIVLGSQSYGEGAAKKLDHPANFTRPLKTKDRRV